MTISTITIGANSYTSYASVAEADARMAVDPVRSAAWALLSVDDKGARLVAATFRLDLLNWAGEKAGGAAQLNAWPRTGVSYPDGTAVTETDVPKEVENACILLAGSIELKSSKADAGTSGSNIQMVRAGKAQVQFFRPTSGKALQDETAFALVKPFLDGLTVSGGSGSAAFGTDQSSAFDDSAAYGITRGFP